MQILLMFTETHYYNNIKLIYVAIVIEYKIENFLFHIYVSTLIFFLFRERISNRIMHCINFRCFTISRIVRLIARL